MSLPSRIALWANMKSVRQAPAGREGRQAARAMDVILMGSSELPR
jgi:hypothetical protein